jgi:hypothetical protein
MDAKIDGVANIITRYDLEKFVEFYEHMNPSSNLPYHNRYHMYCMVLNCYEAAFHEALDNTSIRGLLAGAIMHDFGHSGGKQTDSWNIQLAITSLKAAQSYAASTCQGLSSTELESAIDCIKSTEYPYIEKFLTLPQRIIRDADLMQPYESSDYVLLEQYKGLKQEVCPGASVEDFANGVKDFLDGVVWNTRWAIVKSDQLDWEEKKSRLHGLLMGL